jgi:hypothetical protein
LVISGNRSWSVYELRLVKVNAMVSGGLGG